MTTTVVGRELGQDKWIAATWTLATGGMAAYFGAITPDLSALLGSPHARNMIERLGGKGPLSEVLISAGFSVIAVILTAFGISVISRAAAGRDRWQRTGFVGTIGFALAGSTWLLLLAGAMYTVGTVVTGSHPTARFIGVALNHAPAVWTVLAMTAVAWSLRPAWAKAGWGLLILFATIGTLGRLAGFPSWIIQFSPYSRVTLMPVEQFDWVATAALAAGSCILVAIAAYNSRRAGFDVPRHRQVRDRRT